LSGGDPLANQGPDSHADLGRGPPYPGTVAPSGQPRAGHRPWPQAKGDPPRHPS